MIFLQVCHGCYYLIRSKILHRYLIDFELFSLLFAALCHDVDHTGRTNAFETSCYSVLAIKYNDEAVKILIYLVFFGIFEIFGTDTGKSPFRSHL